jgi:hypothetical protein
MNIGSKLVSKLGSPNSRIPMAAKDIFNCTGYTYFSYDAGGSIEGKDRFVDEVGTGALWLFGIPTYKKLIDKTVFKQAGISPDVDMRIIRNKDYFQKALENAPTEKVYNELMQAGNNPKKTMGLTLLKVALSIGLTMASYFGLTKAKQSMTKKNIEKEYLANQVKETSQNIPTINPYSKENPIFSDFTGMKQKNPSFGSAALVNMAENFVLDPIKNMLVLDMGISGERLINSRTDGEFGEYAIKEGSFLFFIYGADKLIKKGIETVSENIFKTPIQLDANFLSSDMAEEVLKSSKLQKEIKDFSSNFSKNTNNMYDFIFKNQNNTVVEVAKKSGLISTIKDSAGNSKIDTRKYIDTKQIQELTKNLEKFIQESKNSKDINSYLKKIKSFKVGSTLLNVGTCCLFLGYIVPKMMYNYRKKQQDGNNDFHVKTAYEKELQAKSLQKSV